MHRRDFLATGGVLLAGLAGPGAAWAGGAVEVELIRDRESGVVAFDPVGLHVDPGTTVRWRNTGGVHTVTAYHPANGGRALRIPREAEAWDSGYLMETGATFARRFDTPGVHDYFCIPHEAAGMAGRVVVGRASGPGARRYDWFAPGDRDWRSVPEAVRATLPPADAIIAQGRIRARR